MLGNEEELLRNFYWTIWNRNENSYPSNRATEVL